jgi:hypothetical protein
MRVAQPLALKIMPAIFEGSGQFSSVRFNGGKMRVAPVLIVGGGFAGTLLQRALSALVPNQTILVSGEPATPLLLASTTSPPLALVHPFPGRSLKCDPFRTTVLSRALPVLAQLAKELPSLVRLHKVIRPLVGTVGQRLLQSYLRGDGDKAAATIAATSTAIDLNSTVPADGVTMETLLYDRIRVAYEFPGLVTEQEHEQGAGALVCSPGYIVKMAELVTRLRQPHVDDVIGGRIGASLKWVRCAFFG